MSLSNEERRGLLQSKIQYYVSQGYQLISQTETSAQLVKKKKFSFWMCALMVGVLYIPYYMSKKDKTVFITVDEYGNISETTGKG